ncbi:hypothetical protein A11A3_03574 [Alcanivorax hongdengensis A-11-3]|uniref:DUF4377 domain-containing protein n=1 Tax=Alcanivorax hongdengensis A-11-3 TaxID=1177179 RepID=L0WHW1_9GAMM|nr:DUF4377 domain-containing protein [Alcanivorax hongdengensis]EKF75405.1 hypothetical protein A11A3_03574 [Alcanivorax hongdengensis A-11-3]
MFWALSILVVTLAACSEKPEGQVLYVAPYPSACIGAGTMACLRIRTDPQANWEVFYGHIEGFTFEPGNEYTLRVKPVTGNENKDPDSRDYQLVSVEEKDSVQDKDPE